MAQINTVAGDIKGNLRKAIQAYDKACEVEADLIVYPEMTITGYPPEDLLLRKDFLALAENAVHAFAAITTGPTAIIGSVFDGGVSGDELYNCAVICSNQKAWAQYFKMHLPNYGVFDEKRYFTPGEVNTTWMIGGTRIGISICEDAWVPNGPMQEQARQGAELLINLSASPYQAGRLNDRQQLLSGIAHETGVPVVYVNLVGGQDELVFDGGSMIFLGDGSLHYSAESFREQVWFTDLAVYDKTQSYTLIAAPLDPIEEIYEALVLGTRDYIQKNGFKEAVLGLSGGIDSALVAAIACAAIGPENVTGILMPSEYSSEGSLTDAEQLAYNLGMHTRFVPIEQARQDLETMLAYAYPDTWGSPDTTEENIQARIRGMILMAISNKFGGIVLTTGNKSEMAMGYATLYGDMAGGFAVIKDVPKTMVYKLCDWINDPRGSGPSPIPLTIINKPPSAELRPGQKDSDSLPEYEILDPIIEQYVNQDLSADQIIASGFDPAVVVRVTTAIDRNEYKRRQAPPGVRISPKAFGKDRRLPIARGTKGT